MEQQQGISKGPLKELSFISRVPGIIKQERAAITEALAASQEQWGTVDQRNRCYSSDLEHYGVKQRWIVVSSDDMKKRAEKRIQKDLLKEKEEAEKKIKKLQKRKFSCQEDAEKALKQINEQLTYHTAYTANISSNKVYSGKGRPTADAKYAIEYQIQGAIDQNADKITSSVQWNSCYVLATTTSLNEVSNKEVIFAYKKQNNSVERGFRFLKDPVFFTSSLFLKKSSRIQALLMIMTLALLVYSVAQRRLRKYLMENEKTLPNQIKNETSTPTLRWLFQIMEGVEQVTITLNGVAQKVITGLSELKTRIVSCFCEEVQKIYGITLLPDPPM